jgi:hypothetical protein
VTWNAYDVSLALESPLHIGWRKLGNLQQTRPYVTGRSLWGALTERLTRDGTPGQPEHYAEMGRRVDEELAFTYFYPSVLTDRIECWPWAGTSEEFSWLFLDSSASTALAGGRSAAEGSLHETEFIAPRTRPTGGTRRGDPVHLVGRVFQREGSDLAWTPSLRRLQIGGERGYGWGRVRAESVMVTASDFAGYGLDLAQDRPCLAAGSKTTLLAHTRAGGGGANRRGSIEPLVGRETRGSGGFGDELTIADVCWAPGAEASEGEQFWIGERGVWEQR